MDDIIRRSVAIEAIEGITWYHQNRNKEMVSGANDAEHQAWYKSQDIYTALESLPSADAVDCTDFILWLLDEIMDEENWELNAVADGEIIARKLKKLGLLEVKDGYYIRHIKNNTKENDLVYRPSAEAKPTVIRSKTLMPIKDFNEWEKRIRETNPDAVVIPCDAEVVSAKALSDIEKWKTWSHTYDNMCQERLKVDIPEPCKKCSNHPSNGGSGICHCILGNNIRW